MIKEITMYTVICDCCGTNSNADSEFAAWNDKDYAVDSAIESGWIERENRHYCPNCYEFNDNDDLIIKTK